VRSTVGEHYGNGSVAFRKFQFVVDAGGERTAVEHFCPRAVRRKRARLFRAANRGSLNLRAKRSAKFQTLGKIQGGQVMDNGHV